MNFHRQPLIGLLLAASLCGAAQAADTSISLPVTELKWFDTGVGPLKAAPAFGDLVKGPHSSFVKLPAGFVSPWHTHTGDYHGVVISGVVSNEVDAQVKDRPLPPGSYWFQKGQAKHVTKCLSTNECVVFISQTSPFDYLDAH